MQECPIPEEGDDFYWNSFWNLSTERPIGMAIGPIPVTKIIWWAEWKRLDLENIETFVTVIRSMDVAYLEWCEEEEERRRKEKEK